MAYDQDFFEYGWEDMISDEGREFVLLPEGDYDFTVSKIERARHAGSEKMPPCNMAKVTVTVWGKEDAPAIAVRPVNHPGVKPSKSVWRGTNAMLSWSWQGCEGNKAEVEVYSDQAEVELLLNGKSLGRKKVKNYQVMFNVRYAAGTLTAVAYDASGREVGRSELKSAVGPYALALHPEKTEVKPGEVVYVPVNVEGADGLVESNADRLVKVTVEGGELLAFGSANPCTEEVYYTGSHTTYYGRALAIVRAGEAGTVVVKADDGQKEAVAEITVKAE